MAIRCLPGELPIAQRECPVADGKYKLGVGDPIDPDDLVFLQWRPYAPGGEADARGDWTSLAVDPTYSAGYPLDRPTHDGLTHVWMGPANGRRSGPVVGLTTYTTIRPLTPEERGEYYRCLPDTTGKVFATWIRSLHLLP